MAAPSYDETQLRKYPFPTEQLKRLSYKDPSVDELISSGVTIQLVYILKILSNFESLACQVKFCYQ